MYRRKYPSGLESYYDLFKRQMEFINFFIIQKMGRRFFPVLVNYVTALHKTAIGGRVWKKVFKVPLDFCLNMQLV